MTQYRIDIANPNGGWPGLPYLLDLPSQRRHLSSALLERGTLIDVDGAREAYNGMTYYHFRTDGIEGWINEHNLAECAKEVEAGLDNYVQMHLGFP